MNINSERITAPAAGADQFPFDAENGTGEMFAALGSGRAPLNLPLGELAVMAREERLYLLTQTDGWAREERQLGRCEFSGRSPALLREAEDIDLDSRHAENSLNWFQYNKAHYDKEES